MSKSNPQTTIVINRILDDIENIQGFITQEIIKNITKNNGKIPLASSKSFQKQADSLLNADPNDPKNKGKAVLSFKATEVGINEKIKSLKEKGASADELKKIEEKLSQVQNDFKKKLSSTEGIRELLEKRVVLQLVLNESNFMVVDEKSKENRFLTPAEKQQYIKEVVEHVKLTPKALSDLLDPKKSTEYKEFQNNIFKNASQSFGSGTVIAGDLKLPILDFNKLKNKDNLENFKKVVKNDVQALSGGASALHINKLIASSESVNKPVSLEAKIKIIDSVINNPSSRLADKLVSDFESKNKHVSIETKLKFIEIAEKVTKQSGGEFVEKNLDKVAKALYKEIEKEKTLLSSVRGDLKISSIKFDKITEKIHTDLKSDIVKFEQDKANLAYKELMKSPKQFVQKQEQLAKKEVNKGNVFSLSHEIGSKIASLHPNPPQIPPRPKYVESKSTEVSAGNKVVQPTESTKPQAPGKKPPLIPPKPLKVPPMLKKPDDKSGWGR